MTKTARGLAISCCLSLSACATYEMTYEPDGPVLDPAASYAIVHFETKRANLSEIICEALAARGVSSSIVASADSAAPSQFIIRHESSWFWDVSWYLQMLTVGVYDPTDNSLRAATLAGRYSLMRDVPEIIVDTAIAPLFGDVKPEAPATKGSCETPLAAVKDQ